MKFLTLFSGPCGELSMKRFLAFSFAVVSIILMFQGANIAYVGVSAGMCLTLLGIGSFTKT